MYPQASSKIWHPYLGEWVVLAPITGGRPWNGTTLPGGREVPGPSFDPACHLCPGARRSSGKMNPKYADVFVFENDFPALSLEAPTRGNCRVVCFSPTHNLTLAEMETVDVEKVLRAFCDQFRELSAVPGIEYVMPFENKGKEIGVSNPHPHGQIYSTDFIPRIPETMYRHAAEFSARHHGCVFCDVLERELRQENGVVLRNKYFVAFVPAFARFKYEAHIVPIRHVPFITSLQAPEIRALAEIYREMMVRYDNLFGIRIPNITIFYNAPTQPGLAVEPWHFHIQFAPPIRSADKLKYLAGFETGGGNIVNPSLPAESARELREAGVVHFSKAPTP